MQRFPDVVFLGEKHRDELAAIYSAADVFVFPSRTDTFGLVMLEALACGVPVGGFPGGRAERCHRQCAGRCVERGSA